MAALANLVRCPSCRSECCSAHSTIRAKRSVCIAIAPGKPANSGDRTCFSKNWTTMSWSHSSASTVFVRMQQKLAYAKSGRSDESHPNTVAARRASFFFSGVWSRACRSAGNTRPTNTAFCETSPPQSKLVFIFQVRSGESQPRQFGFNYYFF